MATPNVRTLSIKTRVVTRLHKELLSYVTELTDNKRRTAEVRETGDHSKLQQWENVCAETQGMIPDTQSRLNTAVDELKALVPNAEFRGTSELKNAHDEIAKAEATLAQRVSASFS